MPSASARRPAVGFIFVTLMLAIMGFSMIIPVLPRLVVQFEGGDVTGGSHSFGWLVSIYALMQFVGSPVLGALSDRFGRRPIILIAAAGSAIDYVIMALAPTLAWFFVARTIAGFTAGVYATANAYVVDITPPDKRAGAFGLLGAAFGIGFVIGPALGGLLGQFDLRLPFWVAAGCSALNWLFGLFVLPESLPRTHRRAFDWKRANPVGALLALRRLPSVLGLAGSYFCLVTAQTMIFSTWALHSSYRYHWDPLGVGLSLMYAGLLSGLVQGLLVRRIVPAIGDSRAVLSAFGVAIAAYVAYALAPQGWMVFAILTGGAYATISGPALQSYITRRVPPNEHGAVQGVYAGLASLAGIPGPFIATWSFGWAIAPERSLPLPGIAFLEAALLIVLAFTLALRCFRRDAAHNPPGPAADPR
ncbi:MAG: TCR/Tet family MFS transporter [Opitutaceae bacterium]|nr:TCR/Tet family MFS transporter [Opitutaceae bacterium]